MGNNNKVMPILMNGNKRNKSKIKGISKHPLYLVRRAMIHRCYNPNVKCYHNYGGRGIKVCEEWMNNQEAFISFCEANGWKRGLIIDRVNNDGNYEPSNVRFVTPKESSRNMRTNVLITINGITKILEDWCLFYNISSKLVQNRIRREKWDVQVALTTPAFKDGGGIKKKVLSQEDAVNVRNEYSNGGIYMWQLADKYGVSTTYICAIIHHQTKHL